ncbi:MAG: alpha/beta hydrolase [Acidimicrobiia bacterium]|nr:alpha/beta hydrolase [Acidimicrobiia bacterium]
MAITTRANNTQTATSDTSEPEQRDRPWTGRIRRLVAGLVAVVALTVVGGVTYQAAASSIDDRRHPAPGVLVDVGGHRLHLWCTGSGSPTVILESGLGGFSLDWSHLQPDIATTTRVCSYDRAGYGWSDGRPTQSSSAEVATDLRAVLAGAGEDGPFLVVGHSIGGLHARSFARRYPAEVVALVLIDSSHENQALRLTMLDPLDDATRAVLRTCERISPFGVPRLLGAQDEAIPDSLEISEDTREAWESRLNQTRFCTTVLGELDAIQADISQPDPPADLGDLPLTVLSSGLGATSDDAADIDGLTQDDLTEATRIMADLHRELAALSTNSTHHVDPHAGHYIHWDNPAVVLSAIDDAIEGTIEWTR